MVFPLSDLPILTKGKGNKIINIATSAYFAGEDSLLAVVIVGPNQQVRLVSGKREFIFKPSDLAYYTGERARKGNKLPRGLQKVDEITVI